MGNFNRGRPGRGFSGGGRSSFNDRGRGSRGPVEMHQAVCDNCKKECEVPFRPTSGKPVFCSSCFEGSRGSESGRSENRSYDRPNRFEDRRMFDAVCDECQNNCQVPFRPTGGKPVYCSNCFGDKKEGGNRHREQSQSQPQYQEQFAELNNKLDRILTMLTPAVEPEKTLTPVKKPVKRKKASSV